LLSVFYYFNNTGSKMKLYAQRLDHLFFYNPSITADAANVIIERIIVTEE